MIPVLLLFALFCLAAYTILFIGFKKSLSSKKIKSLSVLSGLAASLVLLFQSTGGIVLADFLIMSLILVIAYLYINRF